jgi:hypothetical protein
MTVGEGVGVISVLFAATFARNEFTRAGTSASDARQFRIRRRKSGLPRVGGRPKGEAGGEHTQPTSCDQEGGLKVGAGL